MSIFTVIIIGCWAVFILYWIASSFGIKRDLNRGAWWRSWWLRIAIIAVLLAWLSHTAVLGRFSYHVGFIQSAPFNMALAVIGAALCILGIALAIWARIHLGRNWSPTPALKEAHELVTSGPYTLIRHPIYTGISMAILGSALVSTWWFIIFIVICLMFIWRVGV